jgi:hypothetical protein
VYVVARLTLGSRSNFGGWGLPHTFRVLGIADNTSGGLLYAASLFSWLSLLRFTSGSVSAYNNHVFMIVLKVLYLLFLVVFVYLDIFFTGVLSFLKVNFFGL